MLEAVIGLILSVWLGSIEWRMRNMLNKIDERYTKDDIKEIIDLKQESIKSSLKELKEDTKALSSKLDRLLEHSTGR